MKKLLTSLATTALFLGAASNALAEDFPATIDFRKAATGPGYVLVINTTIKQDLPAILTVTSTALGTAHRKVINLTWRRPTQIGYLEGITVYPGDHIELANNYFETLAVDMPR